MKKKTKNGHRPVVDGSKLRRGMHVAVNYTEGTEHENWIGCGTFMRHVRPGMGWDYCLKIEPHCIVKTDSTDNGSCFPTRCVKPNALGERCAVAHTLHPIVGNSELEVADV